MAALVLGLVTLAFQLPWLGRAIDPSERNLGHYFGLACKVWERFGFAELRGAPVFLWFPASPREAFVYLNHPPGVFWLMYALGTEEWALRLPGTIAGWLAALGMYRVLEPRLPRALAGGAALAFVGSRGLALTGVGSYENIVVAAGLWLWVVTERLATAAPGQRRGLRAAQLALACLGAWTDWMFAFYALALVPLVGRGVRGTLTRLWLPGTVAAASAVAVFLWVGWVLDAPFAANSARPPAGEVLGSLVGDRPPFADWVRAALHLLAYVAGLPVLLLATVGVAVLAIRQPRLLAALALAALGPVLVFAHHALNHSVFYVHATPLLFTAAFAALAMLAQRWRRGGGVALVASAVLAAVSFVLSWRERSALATSLLRDVGAGMVAEAQREGGAVVLTDFRFAFQYYTPHPLVLPVPVRDAAWSEGFRNVPQARRGVRFLWWDGSEHTPLDDYLAGFSWEPAVFTARMPAVLQPPPGWPRWVTLPPR